MWAALAQWTFEPVPVLGCALAGVLYARGRAAMQRSGLVARRRDALWFYTGLILLFLALVSPLDGLDLQYQWVHMVQHVVLLVVAPPLILLGDPWATAWRGLRSLRSDIGDPPRQLLRALGALRNGRRGAAIASVAFAADLVAWHVPVLYDLTLHVEWVHDLEHTLFLVTGLLFWDQALGCWRTPPQLSHLARAVVVLSGMIVSWVLAIVIGYASHPLYEYPVHSGLSPLADQQIAAGVMWVPGGVPFIAVLVAILASWFEADETGAAQSQGAALHVEVK